MINLNQILAEISSSKDYDEKNQMLTMLLAAIKSKRFKPKKEEKSVLSDFAVYEMKTVIDAVKATESYRAKSLMFRYADTFYFVIMAIHKSPAELSPEKIATMKQVGELMEKELYLEQKMDTSFSQDIISVADVDDLLKRLSETKDEYEKGLFYAGLLHYRDKIGNLLESSKLAIANYMAKEFERYISVYGSDEEIDHALEALCDACAYFMNDDITALLYKAMELGKNNINMFAARSLLCAGKEIPENVTKALAEDLIYADRFYHALKAVGKESLFPTELINEEYLAKSDLVQWLTYPTELGRAPDEIEYVGKTELKGEVYHIFKFRSDSDTLGDDLKNKWLIGWANDEGGTFSNFDEYEKFDKGTPEKTVKYIKKKLL